MKYLKLVLLISLGYTSFLNGQMFNGGCDITVQAGATLHIEGSYIHQDGTINNNGTINLGGDFENNSGENPFSGNTGLTAFLGDGSISGDFTNFYNVTLAGESLSILGNDFSIDGTLDLGSSILALNGNRLLLHNPASEAITASTGGILANDPTTVIWAASGNTGPFTIPFHNGSERLDWSLNLDSPGADSTSISVSTFATATDNTSTPMPVQDLLILGEDNGLNLVDRLWHVVPMGFSQDPTGTMSFTYSVEDNLDNLIIADELSVFKNDQASPWEMITSSVDQNRVSGIESVALDGFYKLGSQLAQIDITGNPIVHYNLNECDAYLSTETNQDYSEFTPSFPSSLSCSSIDASVVERQMPTVNQHSCTPGVNGTEAMCVSSDSACDFQDDSDRAVNFSITLNPEVGETATLGGISFFEKAPAFFDWIDGAEGINNYPTLFGIRVLKNGVEIFRSVDQETSLEWQQQEFGFAGDEFTVSESTTFVFELLAYCQIGNSAQVNAWDLDEIMVFGACDENASGSTFAGNVSTVNGDNMREVFATISDQDGNLVSSDITNDNGYFEFPEISNQGELNLNLDYEDSNLMKDVNASDLISLFYHILGIQPFNDSHLHIAADMNKDNRISLSDFLELRDLIIGRETMSSDEQWVFVEPIKSDIPVLLADDLPLSYNQADQSSFKLIRSIKLGNLNFTDERRADSEEVEIRNFYDLRIENEQLVSNQNTSISVVSNYKEIPNALQGTFVIDDQVDLLDLTSDLFEIDFFEIKPNTYNFILVNKQDHELSNKFDGKLFDLNLFAKTDLELKEAIRVNQAGLKSEAIFDDNHGILNTKLIFEEGLVLDKNSIQNFPNPFKDYTQISFFIDQLGSDASLIISDLNGKTLKTFKSLKEGLNEFRVSSNDFVESKSGTYLLQLFNNGIVTTKKMQIIN